MVDRFASFDASIWSLGLKENPTSKWLRFSVPVFPPRGESIPNISAPVAADSYSRGHLSRPHRFLHMLRRISFAKILQTASPVCEFPQAWPLRANLPAAWANQERATFGSDPFAECDFVPIRSYDKGYNRYSHNILKNMARGPGFEPEPLVQSRGYPLGTLPQRAAEPAGGAARGTSPAPLASPHDLRRRRRKCRFFLRRTAGVPLPCRRGRLAPRFRLLRKAGGTIRDLSESLRASNRPLTPGFG